VQTNTKQQVLSRDVLDAVPTARTIQGIGQIVVGVALTAPDVGGSQAMQQTYFSVHGTGREQTVVTVDGQLVDGMMYDGGVQPYFLDSMTQETVYQTGGGTGEALTGGLKLNMVPRDGGNRFSGSGFVSYESGAWQSDNLTSRLQSLGVVTVDKIDQTFDNTSRGRADRAEQAVVLRHGAHGALRQAGRQHVHARRFAGHIGRAARRGSRPSHLADEPAKQAGAYMDFNHRFRGHAMSPGDDPLTSSVVWHTPLFLSGAPIKWTMAAPSGLPPYLAGLYEVPLLTRKQEAHLFRKMNYVKYKAARLPRQARRRPAQAESDGPESTASTTRPWRTKNQIIRCNLRLVVSIAKRHVGPTQNFFELVSDGNMSLMRAWRSSTTAGATSFSTYATWAVMKNFARTIPDEHRHHDRFRTSHAELFSATEDDRADPIEQESRQSQREAQVEKILDRLDEREQRIIIRRFGLRRGQEPLTLKQVGAELGVTKERVRQIEARALSKLRKAAEEEKVEFPA